MPPPPDVALMHLCAASPSPPPPVAVVGSCRGIKILLLHGTTQAGQARPQQQHFVPTTSPLYQQGPRTAKVTLLLWAQPGTETRCWNKLAPTHPQLPSNSWGTAYPEAILKLCMATLPRLINLSGCTRVQLLRKSKYVVLSIHQLNSDRCWNHFPRRNTSGGISFLTRCGLALNLYIHWICKI